MDNLPQSADEFTSWLISFLPEFLQPYAGFLLALIVVVVGVIGFIQPILGMFSKTSDYTPSTGDATLDALLALDSRGKLTVDDRSQLTAALLTRVTRTTTPEQAANPADSTAQRTVIERYVSLPSSREKSELLETFLIDPGKAIADLMAVADDADDYVEVGILAADFDAATAVEAFDRALALSPGNLDAAYHALRLRAVSEGMAHVVDDFEQLLPRTEQKRPDLTAFILLELADQAKFDDRQDDADRQYRRAISIAEATHDMKLLASACHAVADSILSDFRRRASLGGFNPKWDQETIELYEARRLEEADSMLDKAAEAIEKCPDRLVDADIEQKLGRATMAFVRADLEQAERLIREAADLSQESGLKHSQARALGYLALLLSFKTSDWVSNEIVDEAIELTQQVFSGTEMDPDIPAAPLFQMKGRFLFKCGDMENALDAYRRAYAGLEKAGRLDQSTRKLLDLSILLCRSEIKGDFSREEIDAAQEEIDDIIAREEGGKTLPGDKERESYLSIIALSETDGDTESESDFDDLSETVAEDEVSANDFETGANQTAELADSADEEAPSEAGIEAVFSEDESEKFDKALDLMVSGRDRFENEDYSSAKFAFERARELFQETETLTQETEDEIEAKLKVCRDNGA
ncbi:MAG: hypothetical protein CMK09_17350 [Ponticaulis sp.]|nr:hypothetical protein [Ponticaulis sp.]|tara:strand:+ start:15045 stop:16970 length:1926 start_codon:yes stop_codon:yes gene_type:complete